MPAFDKVEPVGCSPRGQPPLPYCTFCGTQVAPNTPICPQCGNPPTGVRQPPAPVKGRSSSLPLILILVLVGGFFLLAVWGIVAAIFILNFMDALQKAKQKRKVADLRNVGTAIVSYSVDHEGALPPGQSLEEIKAALVPDYLASVTTVDGWQRPFRYSCWGEKPGVGGVRPFPNRQRRAGWEVGFGGPVAIWGGDL